MGQICTDSKSHVIWVWIDQFETCCVSAEIDADVDKVSFLIHKLPTEYVQILHVQPQIGNLINPWYAIVKQSESDGKTMTGFNPRSSSRS